MGQVHVASVQADQLPEVIAALRRAGFDVVDVESENREQQQYRCRRGDREIVVEVSPGRQDSGEAFVVLAHPPYSAWPWRWGGDVRFFDDITTVLDGFHYRD